LQVESEKSSFFLFFNQPLSSFPANDGFLIFILDLGAFLKPTTMKNQSFLPIRREKILIKPASNSI
jgi:hypothetical protein